MYWHLRCHKNYIPYSHICITNLAPQLFSSFVHFRWARAELDKNTQQTPHNYAEYRIRRHTITKRAHMSEKTGPRRKMHQRIRIRIKEYTIQLKISSFWWQVGSAEPDLQRVQVHLGEESQPRHLITFYMCIWWEPTSRAINRASPPPQHTLSFHRSKKALLSLALLAR